VVCTDKLTVLHRSQLKMKLLHHHHLPLWSLSLKTWISQLTLGILSSLVLKESISGIWVFQVECVSSLPSNIIKALKERETMERYGITMLSVWFSFHII